jgi:TonB-linked SusC/RagA family outer membrane protein
LEGLSIKGTFNLKRNSYYDLQRSYSPFYYAPIENMSNNEYRLLNFNPDGGTEYLTFNFGNSSIASSVYGEGRITYSKNIKKHSINAMTVGTLRNATTTEVHTLQQSLPMRNISLAGRLAYGYDNRYFLEGNFGYNGSERFAANHRWGFFPSVGAGWMVTNEKAMKSLENVISKLKIKGTYGLVGSDQIGLLSDRFFYLSQITIPDGGRGYYFGTDRTYYRPGVTITRYADPDITWEIAKKLDAGFELTLFKNLDLNADYFSEERSNILQSRADIPSTMGLVTTPQSSLGVATTKGFEVELKYSKSFNRNSWLVLNGNFTYTSSKVKDWEEPDYTDAPWRSRIGQKISQPYGLIAERLFIDDNEVNNSPVQSYGPYMAGDIKYKDINNDGKINDDDMVPIGYPAVPEIIYGFGFSLGIHAFDLSAFFQGSGRSSFFLDPKATTPFINDGQRALLKYYADDHWSENNRNLYALWPRLSDHLIDNNNVTSTWWLRDGTFLRLKNVEIGYSLPEAFTKKAGIQKARFYFSGSNLFVWSIFKMWDPEMAGNGLGYPVQKVYNVGLNLNF